MSSQGHTAKRARVSTRSQTSDKEAEPTIITTPEQPWKSVASGFTDHNADVELISSDEVLFRVHSYQLMAASTVFRSMFTDCATPAGTPKRVILTDEKIEDEETLRAVFNMWSSGKCFELNDKGSWSTNVLHYVRFLVKYDCVMSLGFIRYRLRDTEGDSIHPNLAFCCAALMDDAETCRHIMIARRSCAWLGKRQDTPSRMPQAVPGLSMFDVRAMSQCWLDCIPVTYLRALGRAALIRDGHGGLDGASKSEWKQVADEFYRQVTGDAYRSKSNN